MMFGTPTTPYLYPPPPKKGGGVIECYKRKRDSIHIGFKKKLSQIIGYFVVPKQSSPNQTRQALWRHFDEAFDMFNNQNINLSFETVIIFDTHYPKVQGM